MQLTLALLEQPAAPATPGVPLDPEARAKAIEILVRIIDRPSRHLRNCKTRWPMSDLAKINTSHLSRLAYVYLRESNPAQVKHNRESTARQYALVAKAAELGWPPQQVLVIDEDLGVSGSGIVERSGFARLTAEVALGHVGIVLGLEVYPGP